MQWGVDPRSSRRVARYEPGERDASIPVATAARMAVEGLAAGRLGRGDPRRRTHCGGRGRSRTTRDHGRPCASATSAGPLLRPVSRFGFSRHADTAGQPGAPEARRRRTGLSLRSLPRHLPRCAGHRARGGRAHRVRLDQDRPALRRPVVERDQALHRTRIHATGDGHLRADHLLLEGQYLASEAGAVARARRCVRSPPARTLWRRGSTTVVLRGLERTQSRRILGTRRPAGLLRALRGHRQDDQGDRSDAAGRRSPRPRVRRGCRNSSPTRTRTACRWIS